MQSGFTHTDSPAEEDDAMRYIEYIESTGTQYINTGVAIESGSISYEISASYTVVNANEQDIIGNWTQLPYNSGLTLCGLFDGHIGCHQYGTEHMNLQSDTTPVAEQIYTISGSASAAGQTLTVNGTSYTRSGVAVNSEPFYLFCNGTELNRWAHVRLYSCKIWDGSTLVRDFVPAVDNGTPGLYDRVTDAFYTNSGTSDFLYPKWIMTPEGLVNPEIPDLLPGMSAPYPLQYWRVDPTRNDGYPYHDLLPGVQGIDPELNAITRDRVISVYDLNEPQDGFDGNGLAILEPISCRSYHERNGRWDLTLVHPLDTEWQKWKYLLAQNVLKVNGQLFRIDLQEPEISTDSRTITVHAKHISYDLADERIGEITMPAGNASQFIDFVQSSTLSKIGIFAGQFFDPYEFSIYTDFQDVHGEVNWFNVSVLGTLIGEDECFINTYGGELYRDNFYLSVCKRMQYARDNAFRLTYRREISYIKQSVDFSDFYNEFHAYDNYGNWYSTAWIDGMSGGWHWVLHHSKPIVVKFNFDSPVEDGLGRLMRATEQYYQKVDHPKTSYEIRVADLRRDPRYADFPDFQELRVGDSGIVHVDELNVDDTQEIVMIERDELTGEVLSVRLESLTYPTLRPGYMKNTISSGKTVEDKMNAAMQREIKNAQLKSLPDWHSCRTYTWKEMKKFKWKELTQHGI
jgi:hypothetical protein